MASPQVGGVTPPPARFSLHHTPLDRSASRDLRNSIRRTPSRGPLPLTPHARAALRAREQRRAVLTPGRKRRRSVREQRDTPRDTLRSLSRLLAPTTRPIDSSSSSPSDQDLYRQRRASSRGSIPQNGDGYDDDDDDDLLMSSRPRLSLPIDVDDDESDLRPPETSRLEEQDDDGNYTLRSVEMPRRAFERRASFGSMRLSDYYNPDHTRIEDFTFADEFSPQPDGELGGREDLNAGQLERNDDDAAITRRETLGPAGRESDFGLNVPLDLDGNETTFVLRVSNEGQEGAPDDASTLPSMLPPPPLDDDGSPDDPSNGPSNEPFEPFEPFDYGDGFRSDSDPLEANGPEDESLADGAANGITELDTEDAEGTAHVDATNELFFENITNTTDANATDIGPSAPPQSRKKALRLTKHGTTYPPLPPALVKRVAQSCMRTCGLGFQTKIGPDALAALGQASEWFFERLGDDLAAFSAHGGRKTIDGSDVTLLMKRQRILDPTNSIFSLANRHLPRELLQEIRMPTPAASKRR